MDLKNKPEILSIGHKLALVEHGEVFLSLHILRIAASSPNNDPKLNPNSEFYNIRPNC